MTTIERFALTWLGAWICVTSLAVAQASAPPATSAAARRRHSPKAATLSGKVSTDGSRLVTNRAPGWSVDNTEVLEGQQGKAVKVRCRVDRERHSIYVLSVRPEETFTANAGDAAFRR